MARDRTEVHVRGGCGAKWPCQTPASMARDRTEVHVRGGCGAVCAASSVLFHFSNLTFLFVVHTRNRHDLRSHVLVGNTTLRRRPCIGSSHVQPSMQTTRAPAFLLPLPMTRQTLCCVHTAKLTMRPHATWQEVSLIVAVDRRRL